MAKRILDETATVLSNKPAASGFYKMTLSCPAIGSRFKPGQFFQFRIHPEVNMPLLRRPFAASDADENGFSFLYAVVGEGTKHIMNLKKGSEVSILGPLGNGYTLPRKGSRAILVGGGCGAPSLLFLAKVLREKGVHVHTVLGARSKDLLLEKTAFQKASDKLLLATDDGSAGFHGHSVAAVESILTKDGATPAPNFFACGPAPMLRNLSQYCVAQGYSCQVSLEERMACGFGACMGCVTKIAAENEDGFVFKRVCKDGPVFDAKELVW